MEHPTDFVTIYIVLKIFLFKKTMKNNNNKKPSTLLMGIDPKREVVFHNWATSPFSDCLREGNVLFHDALNTFYLRL